MTEFISSLDLSPSLCHDALMTILPPHAARLYSEAKRFEFRKTIPRLMPKRIFLYETDTASAITGHIVVDEILVGSPAYIWSVTGEAGTSRISFEKYFSGRHLAYALRVGAAVRYSNPLNKDSISKVERGFRVPQNFLYLQNLPHLQALLTRIAVDESLSSSRGPVMLKPLDPGDLRPFKRLVKEHVSEGYSETGEEYANKLLSIADLGEDPEGFLTLSKHIRSINYSGRNIGYLVLTFKIGGSIKTGPVILDEKYRSKGIGKSVRSEIHRVALALGYRKVFATVPADNAPACRYLLASGYRIEAHLGTPYHPRHDEFVLGKVLDTRRGTAPEFVRQITPADDFKEVVVPSAEITSFLRSEFSAEFCCVSDDWAERQVRMAVAKRTAFKPRYIFAAYGACLLALAVCLPKRGGSVKVLLLTRTGHEPSLVAFLKYIAERLPRTAGVDVRRIYSQVPVADHQVMNAFHAFGFRAEGVIELPFSNQADTVILAKSAR